MPAKIKKLIPQGLFRFFQPAYHFLLAYLTNVFYAFPAERLIVIGVTGTAGKTSTVYLIAKMFSATGFKTGFSSTAVFSDGDREWLNDKKMTMPGRGFLPRLLRRMLKNGCRYAVIETTSEGIKQFRHRFINYDVLVFTGLYPEHIEAHGGFENYRAAKGKLFAHLKRGRSKYVNEQKIVCRPASGLKKIDLNRVVKTIIVNGDGGEAEYFLDFWSEAKLVYTLNPVATADQFLKNLPRESAAADFTLLVGSQVNASANGTSFSVNGQEINLALLGEFNAVNALAAYAVGLNQRLSPEKIRAGLASVPALAGKMEIIRAGQDFIALVDYAFEPRALEKLYATVKLLPHRHLIHVLGSAGGGRDRARRPILGRLAGENADIVIVTNEDPYDEDPEAIIAQVAAGAEKAGKKPGEKLFKITDRREAIRKALTLAEKDDMVLFTGKGAEQYICASNGRKIPWDEREVVRQEIGRFGLLTE